MSRNSKIILSKGIKLDRSYKQVLGFTETEMFNLLYDNNHRVAYQDNYSFIKERGTIKVQIPYATCLNANYMAFQNPDYSNKWFFAFIDKVNYLSENSTEIYYTIDVWSTWYDYWNTRACYIIREHVSDDTVGSNTIPEGLEHGPYICNNVYYDNIFITNYYIVVMSNTPGMTPSYGPYTNLGGAIINGYCYLCTDTDDIRDRITDATNDANTEVLAVYTVPSVLIDPDNIVDPATGLLSSWQYPYTTKINTLSRPTQLDGYTPVNKKLLTYPYCYCYFHNAVGNSNILYYEKAGTTSDQTVPAGTICLRIFGVASLGASVLAVPSAYNGLALSMADAIPLGKLPVLGWSEDAYTNWLTQNAVNIKGDKITQAVQIAGGLALAGVGAGLTATGVGAGLGVGMITSGLSTAVTGGIGALNSNMEQYQHQIEPDSFKGNINSGDVIEAIQGNYLYLEGMTIRQEYARILDQFFTRYGYKVNKIALPLLTHRANYNYVQIDKDSTTAYSNNHNNINIPAGELELINNLFRSGVTVWHNHNNFGDYSVSNGITS